MREQVNQNDDENQTALIEGLIINGLVQCRPVSEIAADIDRLLHKSSPPSGPDIRLAS